MNMSIDEAIRTLKDDTWIHEVNEDGTAVLWTSYADKFTEALDLAIAALERDRWISVKEELPDIDQDVLVMVHWRDYPEDMMVYGRRYKTRWYLWNGELGELIKGFDITHWMPLPEPPKEET